MATTWYPAIVERGAMGFGVVFPDFPGCVSAGETEQQVASNAREALGLHIRGMLEDGEKIPEPSSMADIQVDPEVQEAYRVMVPVDLPGKTLRLNITMDEGLVAQVDKAASKLGMSRSGLLAMGARRLIDDEKVA
jgi:predicted RNase H-like HicB family nuclease